MSGTFGEDFYLSPLTDQAVLALAMTAAFSAGAAHGRGDDGRGRIGYVARLLEDAVEQRLLGDRDWAERGFVAGLWHVDVAPGMPYSSSVPA